jgi:D-glycero-D-manno-heptose 1,7-bisphosphate phosphatase
MNPPSWPLGADGAWREIVTPELTPARPGLFLDRDGVIVEEVNYLHRVADVRLMPGIAALISRANRADVPVVVVTNQSGIGRGFYGWSDFDAVQREITHRLAGQGAHWDAVFASPFPPGNEPMRKPNPGMLLAGAEAFGLELAVSWILGDRATDMEAGRRAGLEGGLFVGGGYTPEEVDQALRQARDGFRVERIKGLAEATGHLAFLSSA